MSGSNGPAVIRRPTTGQRANNPWVYGSAVVLVLSCAAAWHYFGPGAPPPQETLQTGDTTPVVTRLAKPPPPPADTAPPQVAQPGLFGAAPPAPQAPPATTSADSGPLVAHFDNDISQRGRPHNAAPAPAPAPPPGRAVAGGPDQAPRQAGTERQGGVSYETPGLKVAEVNVLGDLSRTLKPTTRVPCVLDQAIDGTHPGPLVCHVKQDVLSWDTTTTLLPKDTPIEGTYQPLSTGQGRLMAMAATAWLSDGQAVPLGGDPVTDELGRIGADGEVDNRFWARIGNALITDAALMAINLPQTALQSRNGGNTTLNFGTTNTESVVGQVLQSTVNLPPIFKKNQGEVIAILITQPVHFGHIQYEVTR